MKKPNSFGSVYKMSGRRRRPYRAVVSVGYTPEGKRIRQTLGYYATKKEAMTALGVYNASPYELERIRFEDIYRMWSEEHYNEIGEGLAGSYYRAYEHSRSLHRKVFRDLRTIDLENCIKSEQTTPAVQRMMRLLYSQMYKYALRYDLAQRNYAEEVKVEKLSETEKRRPFANEEIEKLWEMLETETDAISLRTIKMILIGIYSGWRVSELCTYELKDDLMYGGVKTENGKNRVVPVHPFIKDLVKIERPTAKAYKKNFPRLMKILGWEHTPHDTRRTFATLASQHGMNENIRKLIMGHKNPDLTERVYTTHTVDELKREMAKIGRNLAPELK